MEKFESDDIAQLKQAVKELEQRVWMLEAWSRNEHVAGVPVAPGSVSPHLASVPPPLPLPLALPVTPRSMPAMLRSEQLGNAEADRFHQGQHDSNSHLPQPGSASPSLEFRSAMPAPTGNPERSLETRIGLYWLNRLGIASLVLGVVFLILYSFQYFGAGAKVAAGYACSTVLMFLAYRVWSKPDMSWYAQGLAGGGWALAYFTTFAMGYIPGVQLIPNTSLELMLLIAVAGGALWQSLHEDSETISILSNVLAFISVFLAGISASTILATAVLLAALGYCTGKKQWFGLYVCTILCSYAAFIGAQSQTHVPFGANFLTPEVLIAAVIYTMFWLTYTTLGIRLQPACAASRRLLIWGCVINGLTYTACMSGVLSSAHVDQHWLVPLAIGAAYLSAWRVGGKTAPAAITHLMMGLTFVNVALWNMFDNPTTIAACAIECCLLTYVGLRYAIPSMRWFSLIVGMGTGLEALMQIAVQTDYFFQIKHWIPLLTLCASSCALCTYYYGNKFLDTLETKPRENLFAVYFLGACYLFYMVPTCGFDGTVRAVMWAAETAIIGYLGFRFQRQLMRDTAASVTICWALAVSFNSGDIGIAATIFLLALLVAQLPYISGNSQGISKGERDFLFYSVLCSAMLINVCSSGKLPSQLVSPISAVEGVILLSLGFAWREKRIRVWALLIFAALAIKLLFVDLANAGTIERIISFIITGIALLACSYGYAWYVKQQEKPAEATATDDGATSATEANN